MNLGGIRSGCHHASRAYISVALAASCLTAVPAAGQLSGSQQSSPLQSPGGQAFAPTTTASALPVARVWWVEQAPALDGDVLGEAVWSAATPETGTLTRCVPGDRRDGQSSLEKVLCVELYSHDPFDVTGPVSDDQNFFGRREEAIDLARKLQKGSNSDVPCDAEGWEDLNN